MRPGEKIVGGVAQLTHDAKKTVVLASHFTKVIFAKPFRFNKKFKPPEPDRASRVLDTNDHEYLKSIVKSDSDFVLSNLAEEEVNMLIEAMEKFKVAPGETIIEQGDVGDYLYVLKEGSVRYLKDGSEIGTAGPGEVFGELALLYDCPRAATVVAEGDCLLFRASRETFRMLQASFVLSNDDETRRLLKKTQIFQDLPDEIIRELASYIFQKSFRKGDHLIEKGKSVDVIYFLKHGRARATGIQMHGNNYADCELKSGDSFGERAIVMNQNSIATVECLTDGMAYVLTKERFLNCMQDMNVHELIQNSMDAKVLSVMPFFVNSDISPIELRQMAKRVKEKTLEPGDVLSNIGDMMEPSLYFIATKTKSPRLEMTASDGVSKVLGVSEPFGFGKQAMIVANLLNIDPDAADHYRKEHNLVHLDTPEEIQAQMRNIMERNLVVSQYHIQNRGSETVYCRTVALKDVIDIIYDPSRLGKNYRANAAFDNSITYETLERRVLLGQGSFGQVWLCRDPVHDAPYALKIQYKRELIEQHQAEGVIRETRVMRQMYHPFVMGLVQAQQDEQCLYMMMELIQGGELRQQMRNDERPYLSEAAAKFYAACMLEGLSYMHRRNFVYRDLKGENVLLDKDGYCVIVDLGFAKHVPDKTFTFCGTPIFIAPEILLSKGHDKSADIWSFGVMLYEMLFGTNPFFDYDDPTLDQRTLFKRIVKASFQRPRKQSSLDAYANTSDAAKDLIRRLLEVKPSKRLGCTGKGDLSIRSHPWFSDIDWGKLYRKEIKAPWVPEISDPFDGTNFNTVIPRTKNGLKKLSDWEQKQFEEFG
eukprot:CAMPEP_0116079954 /NCGR_PEP_ID=MMETSP0327-20121206/1416_1 /TAXON_ID=44447 /ORGANISM="Pseudo-nitzschia delicatissima, Strain B596" /LENGTH=818 /DNA_ID=CAMNT_0003570611 /DNA_START=216 /DNA_END=2673 /DNA_ORIENTATION=+